MDDGVPCIHECVHVCMQTCPGGGVGFYLPRMAPAILAARMDSASGATQLLGR